MKTVCVVTFIPSPYQVELFDAIAAAGNLAIRVIYVAPSEPGRQWSARALSHDAETLGTTSVGSSRLQGWLKEANLVVFAWYRHPEVRRWMRARADSGRPWCFWGEAPGAKGGGLVGVAARRWMLRVLHGSKAPIWGIGGRAVDKYRREFGEGRKYFNIPYFSDLSRFLAIPRESKSQGRNKTILFTGSLIKRKGVDLLVNAFADLSVKFPATRLRLVGAGPLGPQIQKQAGISEGRIVVEGFVDWDALPDAYEDADLLCAPSRYDGWGLIVPEGMAAGLPVISTDQTGAALDLIHEGQNGFICRAGSSESLRQAMEKWFLLSDEERSVLAGNARSTARGYSIDSGRARFERAALESLGEDS